MKDGEEGQSFAFKLKQIDLGGDGDGDAISSCVVEAANGFVDLKAKQSVAGGTVQQLLLTTARNLGADTTQGADAQAVIDQAVKSMKQGPRRDQRRNNAKKTLKTLLENRVLVLREGKLYSPDAETQSSEGVVH